MLFGEWYYLPFMLGTLVLYWVLFRTTNSRLLFIALASFGFIAYLQWQTMVGLVLLSLLVYLLGRRLRNKERRLRGDLLFAVVLVLIPLLYFKYLAPPFRLNFLVYSDAIVPLGASFATFKMIHYLIDSARGRIPEHGVVEFLAYIAFLPMFSAGPIERFQNFHKAAEALTISGTDFSEGAERILIGLAKKMLVADLVLRAFNGYHVVYDWDMLPFRWWVLLACSFALFLQDYFDFSGQMDMVVGTGRLFGVKLMENFNYPVLRASIPEYWRCYHISLTSWCRDYIYFPVLLTFRSQSLATLISFMTLAVWHDYLAGWWFWGLHQAIGIILYTYYLKLVAKRQGMQRLRSTRWWAVLGILFQWWFQSISFLLIYLPGEKDRSYANASHSLTMYLRALTFGQVK